MLLMTLRDLRFRAKRVIVVVAGSTIVFTLVLLMSGLSARFDLEPKQTVGGMGAEAWILPRGTTGSFANATPFDASVADGVRGARTVEAVVTARYGITDGSSVHDAMVVGSTLGGLVDPTVVAGRMPEGSGEALIDDSADLTLGDEFDLGGKRFKIVGLTTDRTLYAGIPLVFVAFRDAQQTVLHNTSQATALLAERTPKDVPNGFVAIPSEAIREDAARPLERASASVNLVTVLLWVVSALILGGVVLLSAMERQRDFAVMKAVGARTDWLLASLIIQAIGIALLASLLAAILQTLIAPYFPMKVHVTTRALIQLPIIATLVAVVAGISGMRQVARTDPAAAFAGPGA